MRILKLLLVSALFSFGLLAFIVPKAHAAFNKDLLMDDSIFENTNSMSASTIDTFLNGFGSSCISPNSGFRTPDPQGWSTSQNKYLFSGNVTAGQAIHDTALLYHVNPQVILATMQKEQSLVSGGAGCYQNSPDPASATPMTNQCGSGTRNCTLACTHAGGCMNIALGYGCPNYCDSKDEGFSMQLTLGTWLLRFGEQRAYGKLTGYVGYETGDENFSFSGPMTPGSRQRSASSSTVYYDGSYTTLNGVSINISNGATASLYNFTPFTSGNQSFVNIFEGWFGSTVGSLVKTAYDNTVYLLNGTTANAIYDLNVLNDYAALGPVRVTSASEINTYSSGPVLGHFISDSNGTQYLVNASIKLSFTSCGSVADYGYNCGQAITLDPLLLTKLANGPPVTPLLKSQSNGTVYYVTGGVKRPIPSIGDMLDFKVSMNTLSDSMVNQIPVGLTAYGPGSLVKTANSNTVYMVRDINNLMTVSNFVYPQEFGLYLGVRTIASAYTVLPPTENKIKCNGLNYVVTNGGAYLISDTLITQYGFNQNQFVDVGGVCANLLIPGQPLNRYIRVNNGTVYYVDTGQKRAFTSYSAYVSSGGTSNNTINVSDFFASNIANGPNL